MTRMRSAETGLDLVHAAVTGKSVIVTDGGGLSEATGLGTSEILRGTAHARPDLTTFYVRWGEWLMMLAAAVAAAVLIEAKVSRTGPV
jgi:apolipoprotein N-acyltransferase